MLKWSELKRSADPILAVWPHYRPLFGRWFMHELIEKDELTLKWRERYVPGEDDGVLADHYPDRRAATEAAHTLNPILKKQFMDRAIDPIVKRSLELKIDKAMQAKQRLQDEEALMLAEAMRRHANDNKPNITELKIAQESEQYRQELAEALSAMPYLKMVMVGGPNKWTHVILYLGTNNIWTRPYHAGEKAALIAERAKIANAFDLSATAHWGKTKATIRQILLPRANQLLQLASVQRLLAEALARGERVLVSNGIVFWYEDGEIGWQIKEAAATSEKDGKTIWSEGTILSTNHGRIVVLPYIKENGEHVRGHTKNGPNDGRAKPRHPDHYVEIPFSSYEGDLMIGLFGELPYE